MADIAIAAHGSVVLVTPLTDTARAWIDDYVDVPSWAWLGPSFACEPRLVADLTEALQDAGFELREE